METMAPELESLRERIDGTASVAALQYGLSEIAERIDESDGRSDALAGRLDEVGAGLALRDRRAAPGVPRRRTRISPPGSTLGIGGTVDSLRASVDEVRDAVAEIAQRPAADVGLAARVDAIASTWRLVPRSLAHLPPCWQSSAGARPAMPN